MNRQRFQKRRASVTVEAAIMLPILVGIMLGSIDIAQYINVSQLVCNASREGARIASRDSSDKVAHVEKAIHGYFHDAFPGVSPDVLHDAILIDITNSEGERIPMGDLLGIPSGDPISVRVVFDFHRVRWIAGPRYFGRDINDSTSIGRRE